MPLTTTYLGLLLQSPLVASASPSTANLDDLRRLEDAGAGAVVLPTLFQAQVEAEADSLEAQMGVFASTDPDALTLNSDGYGGLGLLPDRYLDLVRRAVEAVDIPIIASLNGVTPAGWSQYAHLIEAAGAAALELNLYHVPTNLLESGHDVEAGYASIVDDVCNSVRLPVSVKLTPYQSAIGHLAATLVEHGANGLVLFHRPVQPDIDLLSLRLTGDLELGDAAEARLPLLWTALLAGRISASIAACTGVATANQVVKLLLAGADVVMTTSALMRHDIGYMTHLATGLRRWMDEHDIAAVGDMRGTMSWQRAPDRAVLTRANSMQAIDQYGL